MLLAVLVLLAGCVRVDVNVVGELPAERLLAQEQLPLNYFQFYGSHNSYKQAMSAEAMAQLQAINPQAAIALEYWHEPLAAQLDLGLRVLELDVFYDPQARLFGKAGDFPVLHVQNLDTNSHCAELFECMEQINRWAEFNPAHEPLLISFNAKTDVIEQPGFVRPLAFDATAWQALDAALRLGFGGKLLNPAEVLAPEGPKWPALADLRGKVLLLLDEGPEKHLDYLTAVARPALFVNLPAEDSRAAIQVLNDPIGDAAAIKTAVKRGFLVRTRADADTLEARSGDHRRRDAAFASGAHFVSTDYYKAASHFSTNYVVALPRGGSVRCNPVVKSRDCTE